MRVQEREALRIRRNTKPRSGAPRWPAGAAYELALPQGCSAGDLLEVLEFLQACRKLAVLRLACRMLATPSEVQRSVTQALPTTNILLKPLSSNML